MDLELCYKNNDVNLKLVAYSDADLAADLIDWRSVTGCCFSLCASGSIISGSQRNNKLLLYPHVKLNAWLFQLPLLFRR